MNIIYIPENKKGWIILYGVLLHNLDTIVFNEF